MIKWCLNIKLHSTAAYEAIHEEGETPGSPLPVAKHMLVFMVRGMFIDFPFAQFATRTVTTPTVLVIRTNTVSSDHSNTYE